MLIKQEDSKSEIKCDSKGSTFFLMPTPKEEDDEKKLAILPVTSTLNTDIKVKIEENMYAIEKEDIKEITSGLRCKQDITVLPGVKTENVPKSELELIVDEKKICTLSIKMDFSRSPLVKIVRTPEIERAVEKYEEEKKVMFVGGTNKTQQTNTTNNKQTNNALSKTKDTDRGNNVLQENIDNENNALTLDVTDKWKNCFIRLDVMKDHLPNIPNKVVSRRKCRDEDPLNRRTKSANEEEEITSGDSRPFVCSFKDCLANFKKSVALRGHMKTHLESNTFTCSICYKTFRTKIGIKSHLRVHETVKNCKCADCGRSFYDKPQLKSHRCIRILNSKRHECSKCDKSYIGAGYLKTHELRHSNTRPYSCDECGKSFSDKKCLKLHLQVHSGAKPFICQFCKKGFAQKPHLNRHMLLHTGVKPYSCTICSKQFRDRSNFNVHMVYHSGTRPFKCDECSKCFTQSTHLNTHKRSAHSELRPLSCNVCGQRFKQKSTLISHVWTHSDIKPFKCNVCNHSFIQLSYFKNHNCGNNGRRSKKKNPRN